MKKAITTIAMICLSLSCFAENYFVKVNNNEYVLQYGRSIKAHKKNVLEAVYTPTHIFTYPDGNPAYFRNIQKINYTKSNVTFYKDIRTRKCCIDILDDQNNVNKCRIIGINGRNISDYVSVGGNIESFEVYEAVGEINSFTDNNPRLIFINHTGIYIVLQTQNSIETAVYNYFKTGSFDFKGEIMKISAINGKREALEFNEDIGFNCMSNASVSFDIKVKSTPFTKQIEEITGVELITPPSSEQDALRYMAEILDVPVELLVFEEGQVKLVDKVAYVSNSGSGISGGTVSNPLKNRLPLPLFTPAASGEFVFGSTGGSSNVIRPPLDIKVYQKLLKYEFDTSPAAQQQRRRGIASKRWDKE